MEIFKLFGSIFVNTDEADKSMQKTESNAESIATKLGNGVKTAAKWGAAIVSGAAIAATAVTGLATNAAGTADEIDKMSQKIGISTEAYQEWSYVMGQNGMDVEKLSTGMKTLVSQMDSAASGTASAQENFEKLGVSIYDSSGKLKDQETILNETMHALADMENGTEKARLATELFGKAGIEMMPMLNQGSGAMDELTQRAHDLGLVMSEEAVSAGVKLGDTIDDVKKSFEIIGTNIGNDVVPLVQQFAEFIIANMPMVQETIGGLGTVLADIAAAVLPVLMQLAQTLLPVISDLINQLAPVIAQIAETVLPVITSLLQMLLPTIIQLVQGVIPILVTLLQSLTPILDVILAVLAPILQLVSELLGPIIDIISIALQPLIEILSELITDTLSPLIDVIKIVGEVVGTVLKAVLNAVIPVVGNITGILKGVITFLKGVFTGDFKSAFQGIVDIVKNIFGGIVNLIKAPINAVIDIVNSFIGGLNNIKIPDWVPGIGGKGINISTIPKLYKGGILEKGQVGFLEGTGAEAVVPLENNQKWISKVAEDMQQQGIYGDSDAISTLIDILYKILDSIIALDASTIIQVVPDEDKIFNIVKKKNRENVNAGKPSLA